MLSELVAVLRCPVCGDGLAAVPGGLGCPAGHRYDAARQGYVQLTAAAMAHTGDTTAMVAARAGFLSAGHYDFISDAVAEAIAGTAGTVADVGAGTGYHLARVLDARPDRLGLALDASKPAVRRAARCHPRAGAVLCDAWRALPLADAAVDAVINVFAPRNGGEFARVLRPGGVLVVVTPTPGHLCEVVAALDLLSVDPDKADRVAAGLSPGFATPDGGVHEREMWLSHAEVHALVGMGPSAWHADPGRLADRIAALPDPVPVTASVRVDAYRPR